MDKKSISIFVNVRKNSRRCNNKLLRPFAGSTLIDILLKKLKSVTGFPVYFCAYENEFLAKADRYPAVIVIRRSRRSAYEHSDPRYIFEALQSIPTEFVAWINPSHPLLTMNTFLSAIRHFQKNPARSLTSAKKKRGWLYTPDGRPITNRRKLEVDTVMSGWVFEVAHAFHIYRKDYMLTHGTPWANVKNDPLLFEIPHEEAWDIDTEDEFVMVEALYKKTKAGRRS